MQDAKNRRGFIYLSSSKGQSLILISLLVLVFVAYLISFQQPSVESALPRGTVTISQAALEETCGLRVNLVAVTAAGGFVDVRLKILDSKKAKSFLQTSTNFPALFTENRARLDASKEVKEQELQLEDNGNLFIMFPNAGNAVQPGSQVRIIFGDLALEPIDVK